MRSPSIRSKWLGLLVKSVRVLCRAERVPCPWVVLLALAPAHSGLVRPPGAAVFAVAPRHCAAALQGPAAARAYFLTSIALQSIVVPFFTQSIFSPTLIPSPTTTTTLPSGPVAAVQLPFPSPAVQVISSPTATVATRHSTARALPNIFPNGRSIDCSLICAVVG